MGTITSTFNTCLSYLSLGLLVLCCFNSSLYLNAQTCGVGTAQIDLDINNVRTRLLNSGDMWWDPEAGTNIYQVPKDEVNSDGLSKNAFFSAALWIGGIDESENLRVAAQNYRQTGTDFFPGPILQNEDGTFIESSCTNYDRFWKVNGTTIDSFRANFAGSDGYLDPTEIHPSILNWAGKGNPNFTEFTLPSDRDLAPFWDQDGNGIYDPTRGDYPILKSCKEAIYADQMIWWIFNDLAAAHTETGGEPLGIEVGVLAYAFITDDDINNTTFYDYKITNRSNNELKDVLVGQWTDIDLGQFNDDFVGCIPEYNMGIGYNADSEDGIYGADVPLVGVQYLKGITQVEVNSDGIEQEVEKGLHSFTYFDNDFSATGNPENPNHYYGYLNGIWKDGTPYTVGNNGYGGSEVTTFHYPGDPSNPEQWSECSALNTPEDRRMVMSMEPFIFSPGETVDFTMAAYWVQPDEGPLFCPTNQYLKDAADLAAFFIDNLCAEDSVWPGDTDNNGVVQVDDLLPIGYTYGFVGPARPYASTDWIGQYCADWPFSLPVSTYSGLNMKYSDCNGDGIVDLEDTEIINLNMGRVHAKTEIETDEDGIPLYFELIDSENEVNTFSINLGESEFEAEDLYGIAFTATFDLDTGEELELECLDFDLDFSWMGEENESIIAIDYCRAEEGKWDIAITRINQTPINGFGEICRLSAVVEMGSLKTGGLNIPLQLGFENPIIQNAEGETIPLNFSSSSFEVLANAPEISQIGITPALKVFPNPAKDHFYLEYNSNTSQKIKLVLTDKVGKTVFKNTLDSSIGFNRFLIYADNMDQGIYMLSIEDSFGKHKLKIVLLD